jgi:hypothetical protein
MIEVAVHIHGEDCFETQEISVDTEELTCQIPEREEHTHGPMCYGTWVLECQLEEHTHTEECEAKQELTEEDIEGWSRFEVQMYINYIYTKHGYKLGDSTASAREQREHFEQLNWYNEEPRLYSGESEMPMCESHFTDIENHNKRVLVKRRNWLKKHE